MFIVTKFWLNRVVTGQFDNLSSKQVRWFESQGYIVEKIGNC